MRRRHVLMAIAGLILVMTIAHLMRRSRTQPTVTAASANRRAATVRAPNFLTRPGAAAPEGSPVLPAARATAPDASAPRLSRPLNVPYLVSQHDLMSRPIEAFDPRLTPLINGTGTSGRRHYLSVAGEIPRCAYEYLDRLGISEWLFRGQVTVELEITQGHLRFKDVQFDGVEPVVDAEFARCYASAVKRFDIRCVGCRTGTLRIPWMLVSRRFSAQRRDAFTSPDWLRPTRDEQFTILDAPPADPVDRGD